MELTLTTRFIYNGVERLLDNATLKPTAEGNTLLVGFELERNGQESNALKAFRVDRIERIITCSMRPGVAA